MYDVEVQLTGQNGNVFNIIGLVSRGLKRAGFRDAAIEFQRSATQCESYDEVLQLAMRTVNVT
jgi:hypothetical protein